MVEERLFGPLTDHCDTNSKNSEENLDWSSRGGGASTMCESRANSVWNLSFVYGELPVASSINEIPRLQMSARTS